MTRSRGVSRSWPRNALDKASLGLVERYLSLGFAYSEGAPVHRFPLESFLFQDKLGPALVVDPPPLPDAVVGLEAVGVRPADLLEVQAPRLLLALDEELDVERQLAEDLLIGLQRTQPRQARSQRLPRRRKAS